MTRQEHLMIIAMEECAEVQQRLSKALRFGLEQIQEKAIDKPEQNPMRLTNRERITDEYSDLIAVMRMLDMDTVDLNKVQTKIAKVERYLQFSKQLGTLDE